MKNSELKNYAFIDSQNLNLSIKRLGWKLDFHKFRVYLREKYEKAVIVSGDGDFYCLVDYLVKKGKLEKVLIPDSEKYSALLKKVAGSRLAFMNDLRNKLEYNKKSTP